MLHTPIAITAEVGKFYQVPCLFVEGGFYGEEWAPVIGPKHTDKDLGVEFEHWHIDWRFASASVFDICSRGAIGSPHGKVISTDKPSFREGILGEPVLKKRLCKRAMPEFPVSPTNLWRGMERGQQARCNKLKDGHTCPHRNIDLRPFEQADGTAICPGHGLRWNLRTGEMMPRHSLNAPTTTEG